MPKVRISATCASSRVTTNTIIMALCVVGSQYGRKIAQVLARRARLYAGGSRQIRKWIEAAPVTTQDSKAIINFIKSIVFRFGVPHSIIIDNGTNFTSKEFKDYCEGLGIKLKFASVAHPKTNGQVKKANGLICNGIKKRLLAPLEKAKHTWVDELPSVLWSLRTTPNAATQETPFFLVHGVEAVLPVEITHEAPRIAAYDEATSTEALQDDINALDEARDVALARVTQYQQNLGNYHSSRVCPWSFVVGDLVL
jgi:transposase InsO family protein